MSKGMAISVLMSLRSLLFTKSKPELLLLGKLLMRFSISFLLVGARNIEWSFFWSFFR